MSKRFVDKASKAFRLGLVVRKPLTEILKKMDVPFKELDRDEAKAALDRIAESGGITVTAGQLIKNLALAFLLPTGLLYAALKKVYYRSGAETDDGIILEFLAEVPRAFRPTLFYDIWLVVPKSEAGEANMKKMIKTIVGTANAPPLTEEEWEGVKPVAEKFVGKLEVKGATENIWDKI